MSNILTSQEGKVPEIGAQLVEPNSKGYANEEEPFNVPRRSRDIFLSCPELSGMRGMLDCKPLSPPAGSAHTYRTGQMLSIGRRVADRMVDPRRQSEMLCSRYLLDERLRSAGIYHNRLSKHYALFSEAEEGARGDTDAGQPNASMGSKA